MCGFTFSPVSQTGRSVSRLHEYAIKCKDSGRFFLLPHCKISQHIVASCSHF